MEEVFIGDWIKDSVLGSGSFGVVVLWRNKNNDDKIAIKYCKWGDELTSKHRERWTKEVEMMRQFRHLNIVGTRELPNEFIRGLEASNPSKLPILCMEYCSGGDLRQLLNRPESVCGLRESDVREILFDISNAMSFLHQHKITHRDLKPENIVLQPLDALIQIGELANRKVIYKLIDLGYAKEIDSKSVCASFVGTLQYLAPELLYSKTYSNSVDFWSFGLLAFEIMCGVRPFLPNLAPVQWMTHVKKKTPEIICIYESFHGTIEYSSEMFAENQVTQPFQLLIEKWLRIALEWDPKKRGHDWENKVVKFTLPDDDPVKVDNGTAKENYSIFTSLENVLSKKIINIFSVYTYSHLAYEIDEAVLVSTLKRWIETDTKILVEDQVLLSFNIQNKVINSSVVVNYWNPQSNVMIFVYHRHHFLGDELKPRIPNIIKRCLEQPKQNFNFNNMKELYKNCYHLVNKQKELYDALISACIVRIETLKIDGKQLLLNHNGKDKTISNLSAMGDILHSILNISKEEFKKATEAKQKKLGQLEKCWASGQAVLDRISTLKSAWVQMTTRINSAARRSNEMNTTEIYNKLMQRNPYKSLLTDATKAYIDFRRSEKEARGAERQCKDALKISYVCLQTRDKILQDLSAQQFVQKIFDITLEYDKITDVLDTASNNIEQLLQEVASGINAVQKILWDAILDGNDKKYDSSIPDSVLALEMQQKLNFKIGDTVSNYQIGTVKKELPPNNELASLIEESLKTVNSHYLLRKELEKQKMLLNSDMNTFNFSVEKNLATNK